MTAAQIIQGFEVEAVVVFAIVGWRVSSQLLTTGTLGVLGCLFVGGLAVALVGDPIANWGLTALYSDQFMLLPAAMGLGLSPAQSWACVFAYPWCFPMMAYAGRWIARRLGRTSASAGFLGGALVGAALFTLAVPMTFVPHQVIVYQNAPPWPLTLFAGMPGQVQLLDVLGITVFVGLLAAILMPEAGQSRFERLLPRGVVARAAVASVVVLGLFLLAFSPALAVRALGLDTAVGFTHSPFKTVPLYGQVEAYPQAVVDNFVAACRKNTDERSCRCSIDAIRRRFTVDEYRAFEVRLAKRDVPQELVAAVDGCR